MSCYCPQAGRSSVEKDALYEHLRWLQDRVMMVVTSIVMLEIVV